MSLAWVAVSFSSSSDNAKHRATRSSALLAADTQHHFACEICLKITYRFVAMNRRLGAQRTQGRQSIHLCSVIECICLRYAARWPVPQLPNRRPDGITARRRSSSATRVTEGFTSSQLMSTAKIRKVPLVKIYQVMCGGMSQATLANNSIDDGKIAR